ncbi:DUF262 domain-containing protein [Rufibacter sp. LB8]|uniref:DUF262 domain-containing protein n=1 Tax=Rufibacter sp. LB8 TaxID=2777781 RepID=UPI00178C549E|nr:DUF262 domain-containing protein [Rufibacter sp. LB8]
MAKSNFKTVGEYLSLGKKFIIPNYQRGYKWGVPEKDKCAVGVLMGSLLDAFSIKKPQYFLQGVTVSETDRGIVLIDGQQRTTTLFLLLCYLQCTTLRKLTIEYQIREKSETFLRGLVGKSQEQLVEADNPEEDYQDIYYFKKALRTIKDELDDKDDQTAGFLSRFNQYVLHQVHLLYIVIPESKAIRTFTMMNGHKANMKDGELIKAELLRLISLPPEAENATIPATVDDALAAISGTFAMEWDINALRSKYAREWDKWQYWWNRKEIRIFFTSNEDSVVRLERIYFLSKIQDQEFTFDNFKNAFLQKKDKAKKTFAGLRNLQKAFEDWYNDPITYNSLGLVLQSSSDKEKSILSFLKFASQNSRSKQDFQEYAKWLLLNVDISEESDLAKRKKEAAEVVHNLLSGPDVYNVATGDAYKQLLRLNVLKLGNRKFDFSAYTNKSLEHIWSQSKGSLPEHYSGTILDKTLSMHCIGNLVLLEGYINSALSNKPFKEKKEILFEKIKRGSLLMHTLQVFSKTFGKADDKNAMLDLTHDWGPSDIANNKTQFLTEFKNYYGLN